MMKLFSSALIVCAAVVAGGVTAVEQLRGNGNNGIGATAKAAAAAAAAAGRQDDQQERVLFVPPGIKPPTNTKVTETPLNAGLTMAPVSAPSLTVPVTAQSCTPLESAEASLLEEYVVVQYNSSAFDDDGEGNNYLNSDTPYLDFANRTTTFELEITYQYAYGLASGVCPQVGAIREVYAVEVLAYNVTQSTFLLRLGTDSNAAKDRFQDLPTSNNCGILIYNETSDVNNTLDPDWNYTEGRRRNRNLQTQAETNEGAGVGPESAKGEVCDCAPPTALEVLTYFNEAMVLSFNDTRFANWTVATQQLCVIPDCEPESSNSKNSDKQTLTTTTPTATYNSTGVCVQADLAAFSKAPSTMPSHEPSHYPTDTWEPTYTESPAPTGTLEPTDTNSPAPTGTNPPTGEEDSPAPTGTPKPSSTPNPTSETTTTPTTSPSSADDTAAPTAETTSAPTPETTDPPTPETTDPPTPEPTPDPTPATPSPVATPAPAGNFSNFERFLVWDGEQMVVEEQAQPVDGGSSSSESKKKKKIVAMQEVGVTVNQAPFAYEQERHICQKVDAKLIDNAANRKLCQQYLELPYIRTTTTTTTEEDVSSCPHNKQHTVPKTYWSVSKSPAQSQTQVGITLSNPSYVRHHYGDAAASVFITEQCGLEVGQAYDCLAPAAYRADLFRFCALYMHGGVYVDSDLVPLVPLEDLYDPCAVATVGHDWPQGKPQKQMKILAGQAGAPIFLCMLQQIVSAVTARSYPDNPLALTGPMALHECYEKYSDDVAITYHDTRDAAYPYSGMRSVGGNNNKSTLLAFESPNNHNAHNYQRDFESHEVYRSTCPLHQEEKKTKENNNNVNNSVKISNA